MRTIVSAIGTAPYGTLKYLVEIIQPTLKQKQTSFNKFVIICE